VTQNCKLQKIKFYIIADCLFQFEWRCCWSFQMRKREN